MMIQRFHLQQIYFLFTLLTLAASAICIGQEKTRFAVIGDYGSPGQPVADVATLVKSWNPDFVITVGDNNYEIGSAATIDQNIGQYYHKFISPYKGTYGKGDTVNRFFPSLGNHDWGTSGALPYLNYFTLPGNERYYDIVWENVHLFSIDSDPHEPDGISATSVQATWLRTQLAASTAQWKIVYFHHAPYSSCGRHGSHPALQWPFKEWGATAVLAGHDHTYERIQFEDFLYFVNGLGGRSIYNFTTPVEGSQVRYNGDYGAMMVEADYDSITFQFITRTGLVIDRHTVFDTDTVEVIMSEGWNLASIPMNVANSSPAKLFPTAISNVFSFEENHLTTVDTLHRGQGYWIKLPSSQTIKIAGDSVFNDTLTFLKGWNIIGSLSQPIAIKSIIEDPPSVIGSPFYSYSGQYTSVDTLLPGKGYWFKAKRDGLLILSASNAPHAKKKKDRK